MGIEKDFLKKYDLKPLGYEIKDNVKIITTNEGKFILKNKKSNNNKLFRYLQARSFHYFPNLYNNDLDDKYEIYDYVDDYDIPAYDRALELINIVSLLHNKTTHYREIDIDDYKKMYEDLDTQISDLVKYYNELNDIIDKEIYMSPSHYLLVRNISKIYASLDYCKRELDNFYQLIKDNPKQRVVLLHNNLELSHLLRNDNSYLISWNNAKIDIPSYDIVNFYKNNYRDVDFQSLLSIYESKYPLHEEEKKLLFILISIPKKIEFSGNEHNDTVKVNELLNYMSETDKLISPYYTKE